MVIIAYEGKSDGEFFDTLSILEDEQKECIDSFRECYKYELSDKWVYNTFYKQKKYPFDFSHSNFNELKQKLINLFE